MKTLKIILATLLFMGSLHMCAQNLPGAQFIVQKTQDRNDGVFLSQDVKLELISKRGKIRTQETRLFRKDYGEERRQVIFYTYPSNVEGTSFLVFDYPEKDKDDDQWLYIPGLRKTRRVSAANRGDYFLGTDLTYEDIKLGPKINDEDYFHETVGTAEIDGHYCYIVESLPVDNKTAKELGYSKSLAWVDAETWIVRRGKFWDIAGNELKTVYVEDIRLVHGIWTPGKFRVENHKNGHKTNFLFSNVDYSTPIEDDLFSEQALLRGL